MQRGVHLVIFKATCSKTNSRYHI